MLQSVALPDGTTYQFTYDHGGAQTYGELTGITLPTGGSIQYGYAAYSDMFGNRNMWLSSKTAGSAEWQYVTGVGGQCASGYAVCQSDVVFRPDGRAIGFTFGSNAGAPGSWLTNVTYYNAIGSNQTPLVSQSTTWTSTTSANAMPLSVTTQMVDSASPAPSTTVQYSYTGTNLPLDLTP